MSDRYKKQRAFWDWTAFSIFLVGLVGIGAAPKESTWQFGALYLLGGSMLFFRIYILRRRP